MPKRRSNDPFCPLHAPRPEPCVSCRCALLFRRPSTTTAAAESSRPRDNRISSPDEHIGPLDDKVEPRRPVEEGRPDSETHLVAGVGGVVATQPRSLRSGD